jgi:glucose/arabinose dehydrogenase
MEICSPFRTYSHDHCATHRLIRWILHIRRTKRLFRTSRPKACDVSGYRHGFDPPKTFDISRRRSFLLFVRHLFRFSLSVAVFLASTPSDSPAISLPAGFTTEVVVGGLTSPTTIAYAPDGRLFIGQKDGRVRIFQNGNLLAADFVNISGQVNNYEDRGLLGIAVHPDFPTQPYVYLLFTYDPPGTVADGSGARVARLIRFTADSATSYNTAIPSSAVVLLGTNSVLANIGAPSSNDGVPSCENINGYVGHVPDCLPADSKTHTIGTVTFGLDGSLFVGNGDGAQASYVDKRALRTYDLDSLSGKILRIDPLNGTGVS